MGNIRILTTKDPRIVVTLTPEELLGERFPQWPVAGEASFGTLIGRVALRKLLEKRPGFDPTDVSCVRTEFLGDSYSVTLTMRGDWYAKIKNNPNERV
jgi:hypothetical protein